jgi:sec-independent protein translocase protein TatC
MFLLKKVFQLRDHVNPDHEKPFLDHLEDLRVMVFKVTITLIIGMGGCFFFQEELMTILRQPVEQVIVVKEENQLKDTPKTLDVKIWERVKLAERAAPSLTPEERDVFFRLQDIPDIDFHIHSVALLRATLALPKEKREEFLKAVTSDPALRAQVTSLEAKKVNPEVMARGDLRMMSSLKPTETFMLSMKLAFFAGIVVSFPFLLAFILQFILPGLHSNEKKMIWPALAIGFGLFLTGVSFAYFIVLPKALAFFYDWGQSLGVSNEWRIGEYITFATQFTLLFGLAFELPVVVMVIVKLGLLSYRTMARTRSYAIVGVLVLAAVLTPTPDVVTLMLMAAPMYFLYEICIWLAWLGERKEKKQEEAEAKERMERLLRDYEEHEDIRTEHNSEHADHGDDGWKAEETPEHDPYHDYHDYHAEHHGETPEPPKVEELGDSTEEKADPGEPSPDINPEDEERRRSDR